MHGNKAILKIALGERPWVSPSTEYLKWNGKIEVWNVERKSARPEASVALITADTETTTGACGLQVRCLKAR